MKILFITPWRPLAPFFGGNIRTKAILKALAKKYCVTLATFYRSEEQKHQLEIQFERTILFKHDKTQFQKSINSIKSLFSKYPGLVYYFYNSNIIERINYIINDFDFVFFDTCFHPIDEIKLDVPFAVSNHNVESYVFAEMAKLCTFKIGNIREFFNRGSHFQFPSIDYIKTKQLETQFNSQANVSICVSEKDKNFFEKCNPNTFVIENGTYVPTNVTTKNGEKILFLGSFVYKPNRDSFKYFIKYIYPYISDVPVEVVGAGITSISQPNININGYVDDLYKFYSTCGVFIVPLQSGGGTRLKILEALANKIPIVSTTKGIEGFALEHEKHVLIADTAESFADSIKLVLNNTVFAEKLTENGYNFVKDYDWDIICKKLLEIKLT
jgi:polysaccharide biosynthesis protein PslH